MQNRGLRIVAFLILVSACPRVFADTGVPDPRQQVEAVERAFAKTMADRDHEAFSSFLSQEAIFISGPIVLRGKEEVAEHWKLFFAGPDAPFSWEPEMIEVIDSGTLALSTGPVRNAAGTVISTFSSVWRQEVSGEWRIVFDRGNEVCPPAEPGS